MFRTTLNSNWISRFVIEEPFRISFELLAASYAAEEIGLPLVFVEAGSVLRIDRHPAHRIFRLMLTRILIHRFHIHRHLYSLLFIEQDASSTTQRAREPSVIGKRLPKLNIDLDRGNFQGPMQLGNALLEIGEVEKALEAIRESVRLMPESALPKYELC